MFAEMVAPLLQRQPDQGRRRILPIDPSREGHGMLTCYDAEARLPQSDLAYVGFRLAALDTLCQMDISQGLDDEDDGPFGYLLELHEASLLDAAVVYAAFWTAARVISDEREVARFWLKAGPRKVRCKIGSRVQQRFSDLFFEFWDDVDFLSIDELQDLTPEQAKATRELMRLADGAFEEMEEVLMGCHASPVVLANLEGLLTGAEIQGYGRLLVG
jgi:hypothetical protein